MSTHFARYFGLQLTMKEIHYDGFVAKNMILPCLHKTQCQTFKKKKKQENGNEVKNYENRNSKPNFCTVNFCTVL
jgi:hypothetical protein